MVIYDSKTNSCSIYEIKHSEKVSLGQTRHLSDPKKCAVVERRYGRIEKRCVLYRGETHNENSIFYLNVEEYLKKI